MKTHNPITNKDYIPGAGLWPEEQTQRNAPVCGGRSRAQLRERLQLHTAPPAASQGCFSLPPSFSSLSLVFYALFLWYVLWGAASMLLGLDVQHWGWWSWQCLAWRSPASPHRSPWDPSSTWAPACSTARSVHHPHHTTHSVLYFQVTSTAGDGWRSLPAPSKHPTGRSGTTQQASPAPGTSWPPRTR